LLADLDLRFHVHHPFRFANRGDQHFTPELNPQLKKSGNYTNYLRAALLTRAAAAISGWIFQPCHLYFSKHLPDVMR
jgi:hypothetical protein